MAFFESDRERDVTEAIGGLSLANPFLPERVALERAALGDAYVDGGPVWHGRGDEPAPHANVTRLYEIAEPLAERLRARLIAGARPNRAEARAYRNLALYLLYNRYEARLFELISEGGGGCAAWREAFDDDAARLLNHKGLDAPPPCHLLALFFQIRRAFHHVFGFIIGGSMPAARLRAAIWQSIFTHNIERYRRALYDRMGDYTTLVTGPSGTGKELAARAIALSRYIPFDPAKNAFSHDYRASFLPLNLSALSPTLIESELFGHKRGAFTGATADRVGYMEQCPAFGSVFLDEIGETDPAIQVKLLRVMQDRVFQRLGETKERRFRGKAIAATNRDLFAEMEAGRFRRDFYYRLCSDLIETPSLAAQLRDDFGGELRRLLDFLARRAAGESEGAALAEETAGWIERELGTDYPWPGNVRELEQCVRNVMIRGSYRPRRAMAATDPLDAALLDSGLTADALMGRYCRLAYAHHGSYREAARRLDLDWRTLKARIEAVSL